MKQDAIEQWRHRILAREVTSLPPIIERATSFLVGARNQSGSWGAFKNLPMDLHASCIGIQALLACHPKKFNHVIQDAILPLSSHIQSAHADFGVQEAADALSLLCNSAPGTGENEELKRALSLRLQALRRGFGWGAPEPSVSATAEVLLSLQDSSGMGAALVESALSNLLTFQRSEDGGWPIIPGGESALLPSALMLRVLSRMKGARYAKSRLACVNYFSTLLSEKGWKGLREPSTDLFVRSIILRSLACASEARYELVLPGVELVSDEVNHEGAWGTAKNGISSIEMTSLCLLALAAAGENKVTTSRVATEALNVAECAVTELAREKEQLAGDIEGRVRQEISNIIKEKDKLTAQVKQLEGEKRSQASEIVAAQKQISQMQTMIARLGSIRESMDLVPPNVGMFPTEAEFRWREFLLGLFLSPYTAAGLLLSVFVLLVQLWLPARFSWLATSSIYGAVVLMAAASIVLGASQSAIRLLRQQRYNLQRMAYRRAVREPDLYLITEQLASTLTEWAPSKREDFIFRLMRESLGVSPEQHEDYSDYLARRYSDNEIQRRNLRQAMILYLSLPLRGREEIATRLREFTSTAPRT